MELASCLLFGLCDLGFGVITCFCFEVARWLDRFLFYFGGCFCFDWFWDWLVGYVVILDCVTIIEGFMRMFCLVTYCVFLRLLDYDVFRGLVPLFCLLP